MYAALLTCCRWLSACYSESHATFRVLKGPIRGREGKGTNQKEGEEKGGKGWKGKGGEGGDGGEGKVREVGTGLPIG